MSLVGEIFLYGGAIILSIAGIIGCIIPALPGPPLSYFALVLIYYLNNPNGVITGKFMIIWLIITIIVSVLDYAIQPYFTKLTGGSKVAVNYSIAGMIIGMFFFPPIGIIIGPLIGAFVGEMWINKKSFKNSLFPAFGAFIGFLFGTGLKLISSGVMLYYLIRFIFFA